MHLLVKPDLETEEIEDAFIVIRLGPNGTSVDWYGFGDNPTGIICDTLKDALKCARELTPKRGC